jgi:hypothetical protein
MAWLQNTKNATRPSLAIGSDTTGVLLWESSLAKPVNTVTGTGVFAQPLLDLPFQATVSLPAGATDLTLYNGMGSSFLVAISRDPGFSGAVDLSIGNLPAGYTAAVKVNQIPMAVALAGGNLQANRPFPIINGSVGLDAGIANSIYNALNVRLEKRYSMGLNFLMNYTWAKNLESNGSGDSSRDGAPTR